jgi:DNA-binding transcriptional ArsR family regulator
MKTPPDTAARSPHDGGLRGWTFMTTHAHVLLALARDPDGRVADLATAARISERATYRILADLERAGYVVRERDGRRNRYLVNGELPLGDPLIEDDRIADLVELLRPN